MWQLTQLRQANNLMVVQSRHHCLRFLKYSWDMCYLNKGTHCGKTRLFVQKLNLDENMNVWHFAPVCLNKCKSRNKNNFYINDNRFCKILILSLKSILRPFLDKDENYDNSKIDGRRLVLFVYNSHMVLKSSQASKIVAWLFSQWKIRQGY